MKLAIGAAAAAVLLTVIATPPAEALPPTTRTIKDKVEPGKAYDIVEVTMRSAPKSNRPAVIVVTHGRAVTFGDALDVWFDLDNDKAIYLHDTPAKALFGQDERHRSHGCIRVHNALQFAAMLASESGVLDEFEQALAKGDEAYIKLKGEIPVRLLYHTAFWDGARVQFRPDVYGWDDDVAAAIGLVRGGPRKPHQHRPGDVGP